MNRLKKYSFLIITILLIISLGFINVGSSQLSAAAKPESPNDNSLLVMIKALEQKILALEASNEELTERVIDLENNPSIAIGKSLVLLERNGVMERTMETKIGNLIADAYKSVTGADIAIVNGGSIRAPISTGYITNGDVLNVLPFQNKIVVIEISGADLRSALENGFSYMPTPNGRFPQISGMEVVYNLSQPVGSRVISVEINGEPIDFETTYTCATSNFVSTGGDGYTMFIDRPIITESTTEAEVLKAYIVNLPDQTITNEVAAIEGRIIQQP